MANITLAIPPDLQERMKAHAEIRWSDVVRKTILQKVELLDAMDKIAKTSKLTSQDVDALSRKVKLETFHELNSP